MSNTPMNLASKSMSQPSLARGQSMEINARAIAEATKDNVIMIDNFKHQDDWVSNSERRRCHICTKTFGAFRRKHHCRVCGEIVCTQCTLKKQVMLPMVGQTEAKVCVTCVLAYCKPAPSAMPYDIPINGSMISPASVSIPSSVSSRNGRSGRSDFSGNNTHLNSPDVMSGGDGEDDFDYPLDFEWEHPWPKPPVIEDEAQRLDILRSFEILDTPQEDVFDIICDLVSKSLNCPIAAVSFIDHDRQWFKASVGLIQEEIPRNVSFCAHVLYTKESIIVPDTVKDKRFERNPLVTGRAGIRFYAAAPIISPSTGLVLGTVFVFDNHPRERDEVDLATLEKLAGVALKNLEDRRASVVNTSGYDQRQSGATDRSSVITAVSQDYQVHSPNPQSATSATSNAQSHGVQTPTSDTPTSSIIPTVPPVTPTTTPVTTPGTTPVTTPAASSSVSTAQSTAVQGATTQSPPPAPVPQVVAQPPPQAPTQPAPSTETSAPQPSTIVTATPSSEVAPMPKMETMLMSLLNQTTETQAKLASQQSMMYSTISGHGSQINQLAEAVKRMEEKLMKDTKKPANTE